jgi:hypothetical protein
MGDIEQNIERYLKAERILVQLFAALGFCRDECAPFASAALGGRPVALCCTQRYYSLNDLAHPAFDLLRAERERIFGNPESHRWSNAVSPCEYHDPGKGCLLTSHKSPTCIAYLCPAVIEHLREYYGIYAYDFMGVYYALEWILTGQLEEPRYLEFMESIAGMIAVIKDRR